MSGTIFGIGLSQRVKLTGKPEAGWKLYLYEANTSTPVTAYKDTGLTAGQEHPWPIVADAYGTMPGFWLDDGSYRARGTSSSGDTAFFDISSAFALGASSAPTDSGGDTDPLAIFQTGDVMWLDVAGTRSGWVRDNGRSIGSGSSGASERANADCEALFLFLWNNFSDTLCAVSTGRGVSAAADWSANKTINLPDKRGRTAFGLDNMGNSAASRFTGVTFTTGDAITPASLGGENTHVLVTAEMPGHTHTASVTDPGHVHALGTSDTQSGTGAQRGVSGGANAYNTASATTGVTVSNSSTGGDGAHNNAPLLVLGTFYRKL